MELGDDLERGWDVGGSELALDGGGDRLGDVLADVHLRQVVEDGRAGLLGDFGEFLGQGGVALDGGVHGSERRGVGSDGVEIQRAEGGARRLGAAKFLRASLSVRALALELGRIGGRTRRRRLGALRVALLERARLELRRERIRLVTQRSSRRGGGGAAARSATAETATLDARAAATLIAAASAAASATTSTGRHPRGARARRCGEIACRAGPAMLAIGGPADDADRPHRPAVLLKRGFVVHTFARTPSHLLRTRHHGRHAHHLRLRRQARRRDQDRPGSIPRLAPPRARSRMISMPDPSRSPSRESASADQVPRQARAHPRPTRASPALAGSRFDPSQRNDEPEAPARTAPRRRRRAPCLPSTPDELAATRFLFFFAQATHSPRAAPPLRTRAGSPRSPPDLPLQPRTVSVCKVRPATRDRRPPEPPSNNRPDKRHRQLAPDIPLRRARIGHPVRGSIRRDNLSCAPTDPTPRPCSRALLAPIQVTASAESKPANVAAAGAVSLSLLLAGADNALAMDAASMYKQVVSGARRPASPAPARAAPGTARSQDHHLPAVKASARSPPRRSPRPPRLTPAAALQEGGEEG